VKIRKVFLTNFAEAGGGGWLGGEGTLDLETLDGIGSRNRERKRTDM